MHLPRNVKLDRLSHLESGQSKSLVPTRPGLELAGAEGKSQHGWESLCYVLPSPGQACSRCARI